MGASTRTPAQVREAILTAFSTVWTTAGEDLATIAWDNLDFDPQGLENYVFVSFAHSTGTVAALGAGASTYNRRTAIFAAQIFVRHNTGQSRAEALAEIVLDFVESARIQGIRFREPTMTSVGRGAEWFQVNVNAVVEYDTIRTV